VEQIIIRLKNQTSGTRTETVLIYLFGVGPEFVHKSTKPTNTGLHHGTHEGAGSPNAIFNLMAFSGFWGRPCWAGLWARPS
jgi:hypothetical protein